MIQALKSGIIITQRWVDKLLVRRKFQPYIIPVTRVKSIKTTHRLH